MNLQMKSKKILGIIVTLVIILTLSTNFSVTFATDDANTYVFGPMEMVGPNQSMVEKGKIINEIMYLWNTETKTYEEEPVDSSKIIVEVSDENLVSINNNIITAKAEGEITVTYKHTYNNMDFKYERTYYIYDEAFSNTVAPVINKSYMDLKVNGENKKINAGILPLGSAGWPYMNDNYKYNWKIEDDSIAKIDETSVDSESVWKSSVNVTPLKIGTTKITCTVSTADGNESITKTINITVTGDSTPTPTPTPTPSNPEVNPKQDPSETGDKTVAKTILPAAGKSSIIIAIIVIISIAAIVFYNKRKID